MNKYFDLSGEINKIRFNGKYYSHPMTNTYSSKFQVIAELTALEHRIFKNQCDMKEQKFWIWFMGFCTIAHLLGIIPAAAYDKNNIGGTSTGVWVFSISVLLINVSILLYSIYKYRKCKAFLARYSL